MPDEKTPEDVAREELLQKKPEELVDIIFDLAERMRALEKAVGGEDLDSSNSHHSPSTDGPAAKAKSAKVRKERRRKKIASKSRGAQRGHKGKNRKLVAVDEVDSVEVIFPSDCQDCGGRLGPSGRKPVRRQVWDLPAVRPQITEYQLHAGVCSCCSKTTRAALPPEAPAGAFGPRVMATVGYLSGALRGADRPVKEAMSQLYGLEMSLGSVANVRRRLGATLAGPAREVLEYVRRQPVVHVDETGWKAEVRNQWLWTATTPKATAFLIQGGRGKWEAQQILGENFSGVGVTDRLYSYSWIHKHQHCWSHLARDFERIAGRAGTPGLLGRPLVDLGEEVMRLQRRWKSGEIGRGTFATYAHRLKKRVRKLVEAGTKCGGKTAGSCKAILAVWPSLWLFIRDPDIPVTNNAAERAIRPAVLWRRARTGTQSSAGALYVQGILTVVATLRQNGQRILDYLEQVIRADLRGGPLPSLIPV